MSNFFEGPKTLLNEDELSDLERLARERGVSPETYRKRVRYIAAFIPCTQYYSLCHIDNFPFYFIQQKVNYKNLIRHHNTFNYQMVLLIAYQHLKVW